MPQYSVKVMCDECSQMHPLKISITWKDGPGIETSVGNIERGLELPDDVANLVNKQFYFYCPVKKITTTQADKDQVYLVPKD